MQHSKAAESDVPEAPVQTPDLASPPASSGARGRFRPQFSLRTLLLFMLLVGSAATLWWRWTTWVPVSQMVFKGAENYSADFSPDFRRMVLMSCDNVVRVFDVSSGQILFSTPSSSSFHPIFLPDGKRILAADLEGKLGIIDTGDARTQSIEAQSIESASVSRDGQLILFNCDPPMPDPFGGNEGPKTGQTTTVAHVYGIGENQIIAEVSADVGKGRGYAVFSPDCKYIYCTTDTNWSTYDARTGKRLSVSAGKFSNMPTCFFCIKISPDGHRLLTCPGNFSLSDDFSQPEKRRIENCARIWNVETSQLLATIGTPTGNHKLLSATFSPDGNTILSQDTDYKLEIWNAHSFEKLIELPAKGRLLGVSQDGNWLAVGTPDYGPVEVWQRRHSESRFGVCTLPELWLAVIFAIALLWSLGRDWHLLRGKLR